jgi:hypothetical protein
MGKKKPWLGYDHWLASPYDDGDPFHCPDCDTYLEEPENGCECGWYPSEPDFESMVNNDDDY